MSSVKVLRSYTLSLILIAVAQSFLTTSVQAQYGASPSQTGMFFDDLRVRQANERAASSASTRDGDVVYDYSSGVYRDGQSAPMGQRNADYESAREISRPSVRSGSSAFAARSVGDYTNYAGQYTSPTGFFAPTYTSDPYLSGRRNLKIGPANVGFGFYQGLEFNDNVNRSGGDNPATPGLDESPISDVISTTMLSIDANYQITKNNRLSLSTAIGFDRYLDHPEIAPYGNGGYVLNVLPGSTIAFDIKAGPVFLTIYNRFSVRPAARNDFALSQNQTFGVFQNDSGIAANWRINSAWTLSMNYMHSYSDALSTTTGTNGTGNYNFDEFSRVTDSLHGSLTYSPNGTWVAGIEGGSTILEYVNDFNADGVLNNLGAFVVLPVGSTTYLRAAAGTQVFEFNSLPTLKGFTNPLDPTPSGRAVNSGDQSDLSGYYYSLTISNQLNSRVSQAFSVGHESALNLTSNFITADYANYGLSFVAWKGSRITVSGYVEDAEASGGNFAQDIFQYGGDFHIAHRLTSNLQLGVGYHYGYTDPSIGSGGDATLVPFRGDFIQQAFNIDLTYVLSSKATVNLGYRYMITDVSGNRADNARSFNQNRFVLGFNYNF